MYCIIDPLEDHCLLATPARNQLYCIIDPLEDRCLLTTPARNQLYCIIDPLEDRCLLTTPMDDRTGWESMLVNRSTSRLGGSTNHLKRSTWQENGQGKFLTWTLMLGPPPLIPAKLVSASRNNVNSKNTK